MNVDQRTLSVPPSDVFPDPRFASRVEIDHSGCWHYTGALSTWGYGRYRTNGRWCMAHRYAYELAIGPIPDGYQVDHLCHSRRTTYCAKGVQCLHRRCINPFHLEPVTSAENSHREIAVRTHCKNGHPYVEENIAHTAKSRFCLICQRESVRRRDEQRREDSRKRREAKRAECQARLDAEVQAKLARRQIAAEVAAVAAVDLPPAPPGTAAPTLPVGENLRGFALLGLTDGNAWAALSHPGNAAQARAELVSLYAELSHEATLRLRSMAPSEFQNWVWPNRRTRSMIDEKLLILNGVCRDIARAEKSNKRAGGAA